MDHGSLIKLHLTVQCVIKLFIFVLLLLFMTIIVNILYMHCCLRCFNNKKGIHLIKKKKKFVAQGVDFTICRLACANLTFLILEIRQFRLADLWISITRLLLWSSTGQLLFKDQIFVKLLQSKIHNCTDIDARVVSGHHL